MQVIVIYVAEAHAVDQWPRGEQRPHAPWRNIPQHATLQDRIQAAEMLKEEVKFDGLLLVDGMDDDFEKRFAVWPEKAFVLLDGVFAYISNLHEDGSIRWEHELCAFLS